MTPSVDPRFETVLGWCDELRTLGVRANADTPEDARRAREFGAEGIGLCRTEHMFMAADRQPKMQRMIMADDEAGRRAALDELLPLQQADFEGLFEAMDGLPVTIRLLDPPLHEFLPDRFELVERITEARLRGSPELAELEQQLERMRSLEEGNPMLGTRGVRLGLSIPRSTRCRRARSSAPRGRSASARGRAPRVEIMIPLVAYARELELARALVDARGRRGGLRARRDFGVGTMIELPRACFVAGEIARHAEFFSFGTNDLTQTALGFSRDDIEGRVVPHYKDCGIVERSPFGTIDEEGVGELVRMAVERGRAARPGARGRHLRRARRRPGLDRVLPRRRARLRQLLAVPRADRARGGRAGSPTSSSSSLVGLVLARNADDHHEPPPGRDDLDGPAVCSHDRLHYGQAEARTRPVSPCARARAAGRASRASQLPLG